MPDMPPRPLTPKQRKFAEAYVICLNKADAARQAGYKGNAQVLHAVGWENLQKPAIKAYVDQLMAVTTIKPDEILRRLSAQATSDIYDFIDPATGAIDLKKAKEAGLTHLIKEIEQTIVTTDDVEKIYTKVKLYDAQAALVHLGKAHALFSERIQVDDTFKLKALDLIRSGEIDKETFSQDFSESLADELFRLAGISTSTTP